MDGTSPRLTVTADDIKPARALRSSVLPLLPLHPMYAGPTQGVQLIEASMGGARRHTSEVEQMKITQCMSQQKELQLPRAS
jgi:hypothetical protein